MDMSLSKLQELVMDRESMGQSQMWLNWTEHKYSIKRQNCKEKQKTKENHYQ